MSYKVTRVFMWFIAYSFIGWVYETALFTFNERVFVNRGFLNGPICPIYGTGAVLVILLLGRIKHRPFEVFLASMAITAALEYFTSFAMEALFDQVWWEYYDWPLNINGRISLFTSMFFGVFCLALIRFIHPLVSKAVAAIPPRIAELATVSLIIIISADLSVTIGDAMGINERILKAAAPLFGNAQSCVSSILPLLGLR